MNEDKKPLIILTGPTAVGKTALSIRLAKAVNGEIISADSMQVYKKMDIGTAKIMPEEMDGVKHYLVDELMPDDEFNVVKFKQLALTYMEEIYGKGKIPIIVGGTGFYIQAILNDIDFTETNEDHSYREELQKIAEEKGAAYLYEQLRVVDEESTKIIHQNNVKRVIRALEYYHQTGEKISSHNEEQKQKQSPYQFAYFVLNHNREILYDRIEERIDLMIKQGLVDEVTSLYKEGYRRDLVSMQGLGYKEILAYLEGECSLEEAIYILKRDTRHFAKRQITWFKRENDVIWLDRTQYHDDENAILSRMCEILREKNIIN
ncbi:tRNA (adenosine(37)-N6)-dimethylallyltransferase MiaA [Anaerosporobacter faecicola]|uniref:tRNA (adenosine(37)-N6)-dimethylallyltransferase MiaA n=1 Tax=Anaerosporobacter faecicola TaxID=2718714 RepID=UPI00143AB10D|nr:tRNA (adenosine(37)-N6)-dimethylallyltransferase MiaA [Anaerosporobacter faecicola]